MRNRAKSDQTGLSRRRIEVYIICTLLMVSVLASLRQVTDNGYAYDDIGYVIHNPIIHPGLTGKGLAWAFTSFYTGNWHPVTWVSHMTDFSFYYGKPVGHHLTSLLLHLANTLLLFAVLLVATNAPWRSAFVALMFGVHPVHVESVAWISERKDLLSAFFGLLAILAYLAYARKPSAAKYALVAGLFALGLMSKPMLITLPILLLLLDYWPLSRQRPLAWLLREKTPLFAMSAASGVVTAIAQRANETVVTLAAFPLPARLANAAVSYVAYVRKMLWPSDLAAFYPYPMSGHPWWQVAGSIALLVSITILVLRARKRGYLMVGWLWYLVTLVPVIGIMQVGGQAMADRYSYIPLIGLFIMLAWGVPDLVPGRRGVAMLTAAAVLVTLPLVLLTRAQVGYWKNDVTLFTHAIKFTEENWVAEYGLGLALAKQGQWRRALPHAREAARLHPYEVDSQIILGLVLTHTNKLDEAVSRLNQAIMMDPKSAVAYANLADALRLQGDKRAAREQAEIALKLEPGNALAREVLGKIGKL